MFDQIEFEKSVRKWQQYTELDSMFESSALQRFSDLIHKETKMCMLGFKVRYKLLE
jgi:hypothetical protein